MVKESDALLRTFPANGPPPEPPKKRAGVDGIDIPLLDKSFHIPAMVVVCLVVLTYGALSVGFNLYNSFLLRMVPGFKFPVVYTTTHMLAGFIGASVLIFGFKAGTVSWDRFASKWRPLLLLACLRSGTIVLNNWSLVRRPCHMRRPRGGAQGAGTGGRSIGPAYMCLQRGQPRRLQACLFTRPTPRAGAN